MEKKEEIPCTFYYYVHFKLKELFENKEVSLKEVGGFLGRCWRIPKNLRKVFIKELEQLGLIERIGCHSLRLLNTGLDFNNINNIYIVMGMLSLES